MATWSYVRVASYNFKTLYKELNMPIWKAKDGYGFGKEGWDGYGFGILMIEGWDDWWVPLPFETRS